jgi:hypothetical protein
MSRTKNSRLAYYNDPKTYFDMLDALRDAEKEACMHERKKHLPREDESHIHIESKSDTPHELSEDMLISNTLTSTPLVLSSSLLGCSDPTRQAHGEVESSMTLDDTMGLFSPPQEDEPHGYDPTLEARYDTSEGESSDDEALISMKMRDSTICEMSESTICEMSESTICESECFHFEDMSDTPSVIRVVVDRSSEAISISNNLPSISSVFSHVAVDSMDEATSIL